MICRSRLTFWRKRTRTGRGQIVALEQRVRELTGVEQRGGAEVDALKQDLAVMEKRKAEYAQAEAQMRQVA